jgi:tetratricopeptide (TPR) repeat protein
MYKHFLVILFFASSIGSIFGTEYRSVVDLYNPSDELYTIHQEIKFWNQKIKQNPGGFIYYPKIAAAFKGRFDVIGNPKDIITAEHYLQQALLHPLLDPVPLMIQLASVQMTQHRFCDALDLLQQAETIAPKKRSLQFALADVYAELGFSDLEKDILNVYHGESDFQYSIRLAKWYDGQGDLEAAIKLLEETKNKISLQSGINKNASWLYSNLGDFYGHAGQIDRARQHYILALKKDPACWHAAQGLAWISFSSEMDLVATHQIINYVQRWCQAPALDFLKADVLATEGKTVSAHTLRIVTVKNNELDNFGPMYVNHLMDVLLTNADNTSLSWVNDLLNQRQTPENYAYYVQYLLNTGQNELAETIAIEEVWSQTSEPGLLFKILPSIQLNSTIRQDILTQLNQATFEIGPLVTREVAQL